MKGRDHSFCVRILMGAIPFLILFFLGLNVNAQWVSIDVPDVSPSWGLNNGRVLTNGVGWAVGTDVANKRGVLLQFRDNSWRVFDPPNVSPDWELNAIGLSAGNDWWAVGVDYSNGTRTGVILRYLNGLWTIVTPPFVSTDWGLFGIAFSGSNEGWAAGFDYANKRGVLLHYKSSAWAFQEPPNVSLDWGLYGIYMINSNEGWAVGVDNNNQRGALLHFTKDTTITGTTVRKYDWQVVLPPTIDSDWELSSVFFPSTAEGWAVGTNHTEKRGVILHFVTPRWGEVIPPQLSSDFEFDFATFPSTTTGWVSGTDFANGKGILLQFDNKVWIDSPLPDISPEWMVGNVRFAASNQVWAFGTDVTNKKGVILRYSTNVKETISTPSKPNGPTSIAPNVPYTFYTGDSVSSLNHSLQYLLDYGDGTNSGWLSVGTVGGQKSWTTPGTYQVTAQARDVSDTSTVSKVSSGLSVTVTDAPTTITLLSPGDGTSYSACSLYSLPTFAWQADPSSFTSYEIQFSKTASLNVIAASDKVSSTSVQVDFNTWKKVLLAPGLKATGSSTPLAAGGPVFWRVVGTRSDKTLVNSDTLSLEIDTPQPVGNPTITNTSKSSVPTLSWENNCNIKSRVWFGNNAFFTHQTSVTFNIKDPTANGGVFTQSLTPSQWTAVQNVTGRVTGATVFWYVESWDGTNRRVVTQPNMSFAITD